MHNPSSLSENSLNKIQRHLKWYFNGLQKYLMRLQIEMKENLHKAFN